MTIRLFLGGRLHGRRIDVASDLYHYRVPGIVPITWYPRNGDPDDTETPVVTYARKRSPNRKEVVFVAPDYTYDTAEWLAFDTVEWVQRKFGADQWEHLGHPWFWRGRPTQEAFRHDWAYVLGDPQMRFVVTQLVDEAMLASFRGDLEEHLYEDMSREAAYRSLPACVVPGCTEKAPNTFVVRQPRGRLAGREWQFDDKIRFCPKHAVDILRAQGFYGRVDDFPEWMRPDLEMDWLDEFDAGTDLLFGNDIRTTRKRILSLLERR